MRSAVVAFFPLLVACGGNVAVDRGSPSGTTTTSTATGAGGGLTTGTATSTGAGGGVTSTSGTSSGSTGTWTDTTTTTTITDSTTTTTSTSTTTTSGSSALPCGQANVTCAPGDLCCYNKQQGDGQCLGAGSQCGGKGSPDTRIECMLPSDCPGQICCGRRAQDQQNPHYRSVTCRDACDMPDVTICDPADPNPNKCPPKMDGTPADCQKSQLLPDGYFVCSQQ